MTYAAVRIRGTVNIKPDIKKTLDLLNLTRVNHCTLVDESSSTKGMLQTAKDYITWGEIDKEILTKLITMRGKLVGDKKITEDYIKSSTSYTDLDKLTQAIINNKLRYKEIPSVKPIFRLNPPKNGFKGVKKAFINKGSLGYRGKEINKLIERMI